MGYTKLFSSVRVLQRSFYGSIVRRTCCSSPAAEGEDDGEAQNLDGNKVGLVLGVYETKNKFELTSAAEEINQKSGGKICQHLNALSCEMKLGKAFVVTDVLAEYCGVALASLGPRDPGYNELEALDETRENVRWGVGAGVRALRARGCARVHVDTCGAPDAAAEAAELAVWRFQEFKSCDARRECAVLPYGAGEADAGDAGGAGGAVGAGSAGWAAGATRARAQNWARYLCDMPANKMTPVDLAQAALDTLCGAGVRVEARDRAWMRAQRMAATLAVARGSCADPLVLECTYAGGEPRQPPVLLAAAGVTFDSGGLCLKEREEMAESGAGVGGAAVALAAIRILAELKVPINVSAVIPMCENMVSGQCMKVGDVVRALNGISIQIEDTDMEGRLLLADALVYGQTQYKPSLVIDVAALTKGAALATGGGAFGCFASSKAAWRAVRAAGARAGDRPWRFPLWHYYHKQISNDPSVDLRNKGSGTATACLGAAFLKNFVCCDWVHMDIAGVGRPPPGAAPPYLRARRASGRPARALAHLLQDVAEACVSTPAALPSPAGTGQL